MLTYTHGAPVPLTSPATEEGKASAEGSLYQPLDAWLTGNEAFLSLGDYCLHLKAELTEPVQRLHPKAMVC